MTSTLLGDEFLGEGGRADEPVVGEAVDHDQIPALDVALFA